MGEDYIKVDKVMIQETVKGLLDEMVASTIEAKITEYDVKKLITLEIGRQVGSELRTIIFDTVKRIFRSEDITVKGVLSLNEVVVDTIEKALRERVEKMKVVF